MMSRKEYEFDGRIKLPNHFMICGGSQSGKTSHILKAFEFLDKNFTPKPKKVVLCYAEMQDQYMTMRRLLEDQGCEFEMRETTGDLGIKDFTNEDDPPPKREDQTIILFDDLTLITSRSEKVANLTMQGRHR
jgi:hypothetical protein